MYECIQKCTYGDVCSLWLTCSMQMLTALCGMSVLVCVQLVANAVLFTSVNLSGVFVRILTERTQRKVFLQARNCIEERLRLEDENEKQVNLHKTTKKAQIHKKQSEM